MTTEQVAFLNGRFVDQSELTLQYHDAGFVFGATVTDFCRTYRQKLFRWDDHQARLRRDCAALGIPLACTAAELASAAEKLVQHNSKLVDADTELSLITFATPGPIGGLIGAPAPLAPTLGMHTVPIAFARYRKMLTDGITLAVAGLHPSDGIVPAHAKHRNRLHWWLAQQAMTDPTALPVLIDQSGVADTPIGSVLVVRGDHVARPPKGSVLEGVSLSVVRELCETIGLGFAEGLVPVHEITSDPTITEVLLAGSGFGVAGVCRISTTHSDHAIKWPGPVLRRLQLAWSELVGLDIEQQILSAK